VSMNSKSPPRYGAEGPPGGAEAWGRQRNQPQGMSAIGQFARMATNRAGLTQPQSQQPRPTTPDWSQSSPVQWGQRPAPGPSAPPANGMAMMPGPSAPPPRPPAQPPAQGAGMSGLGALARAMAMQRGLK
jgi:hypothetical protein